MIVDIITFNGEFDLLEIRLNVLDPHVDEFIVVEFDKTFSGKNKSFYLNQQIDRFKRFGSKIVYHTVTENQYGKYRELAESSPNTQGADHWKREFMQKEYLKDCLTHLKDDDIVFVGDCDEVPDYVTAWEDFTGSPFKLKLKVYTYYLNNRSSEEFWGTLVSHYRHIKNECLNHLRTNAWKTNFDSGWHFTSMRDQLVQKLTDSYTEETYANRHVLENLEGNIERNKDFLGRDFTYQLDESDWPQYLKDNKEKYVHLCKSGENH